MSWANKSRRIPMAPVRKNEQDLTLQSFADLYPSLFGLYPAKHTFPGPGEHGPLMTYERPDFNVLETLSDRLPLGISDFLSIHPASNGAGIDVLPWNHSQAQQERVC